MKKRFFLALLCALLLSFSQLSEAASREELAAIRVASANDFQYWTDSSPAKAALIQYVKAVTDPDNPDFIPLPDRLAVFDVDGTLMCETAPIYFDMMVYLHRVLDDSTWHAPAAMRAMALERRSALREHRPANLDPDLEGVYQIQAFAGMTLTDYRAYVKRTMQEPVDGLTNLTRGEAFYLPMAEVVAYLAANQFKIYFVSGADRIALRTVVDGIFPVGPEHVIGSDSWIRAAHQGNTDGLHYVYSHEDELVRGEYQQEDTGMNKVSTIAREIGRQPVLAFGNSKGDASMLNYTITNNPYRSAAFILLCDDLNRELGSLKKAQATKALAEKNGWLSVSMRDEFKTIYGDEVKRQQ